jgi:hypothetical protein
MGRPNRPGGDCRSQAGGLIVSRLGVFRVLASFASWHISRLGVIPQLARGGRQCRAGAEGGAEDRLAGEAGRRISQVFTRGNISIILE